MEKGQGFSLVDVHHHILPPEYMAALNDLGVSTSGSVPIPQWSPNESLSLMDENGIAEAVISISAPGVYFKNDAFSRELARRCNEYCARLIDEYPGRFGAFASLPFPDVEGSLKELEYAIDKLKLDGVGLLTNIQGHYLGDPEYKELYKELDRRKTVVFIHPNDPPFGQITRVKAPIAIIEFPLDTTRTIVNLLYGSVLECFPDIRFIFAHAGGAIPYLASRCSGPYTLLVNKERDPEYVIDLLGRQYYEVALSTNPYALRSLQELVEPSHILFGSDYVFAPRLVTSMLISGLREYDGFSKEALKLIERKNALELFPRFKRN
jgi:predicted TIM-barrel fold metal-dependent hydrolase